MKYPAPRICWCRMLQLCSAWAWASGVYHPTPITTVSEILPSEMCIRSDPWKASTWRPTLEIRAQERSKTSCTRTSPWIDPSGGQFISDHNRWNNLMVMGLAVCCILMILKDSALPSHLLLSIILPFNMFIFIRAYSSLLSSVVMRVILAQISIFMM